MKTVNLDTTISDSVVYREFHSQTRRPQSGYVRSAANNTKRLSV